MAVWVITGEEALAGLELTSLVDRLVGDNDRSMMVDDFDLADSRTEVPAIADSLVTMPLFTERRVVVIRNLHAVSAENNDPGLLASVVAALDNRAEQVDVVITATGRQPKIFTDAVKRAGAETIGTEVGTRQGDRIVHVEEHLVAAGFTYAPDVPRLIAQWIGGDFARLAGLVSVLVSAYGENAKLARGDVEVFLGEAGSVPPWDLTDAIDAGDTAQSLRMLRRFLAGAHPFQVLALLGNRYAQMMKLDGRGARTGADAVAVLGGKEFTARKVLEQYQRMGGGAVARAVALIAAADVDLRGGKDWPDELVMEVLVGRLCQLVPAGNVRRPGARR
jgi:DNA polymerase-3 subunit delta